MLDFLILFAVAIAWFFIRACCPRKAHLLINILGAATLGYLMIPIALDRFLAAFPA
ncbi:hypothetical protein [Pseudomonas inefficax]|uniref:hypothetical protein n=1 Tax=Pseudomonas inefficax TaxID=2078786 RepID=UPI004046E78E